MFDKKKILRSLKNTIIIFALILCGVLVMGFIIFQDEIKTIFSLKPLNESNAYELTYVGDYALDKYLVTGAEDWSEVLEFINQNLANGAGKYIYGRSGCSSFFAKTPEGDYLLARNLDTDVAYPCVIRTDSNEGYASLGVSNLMRGGFNEGKWRTKLTVISSPYYTLDGMNEHGLAIASASVPYGKDERQFQNEVAIHDLTVNRVILDKAKNVDEALTLLNKYYIVMEDMFPSHYMIGDASGRCVIVEFKEGYMVVLEKEDSYLISSNFVLNTIENDPTWYCKRYASYEENLSQLEEGITETQAMSLLKKNVIRGQEQWSVVYNLTQKTMTISFVGDSKVFHYEIHDSTLDKTVQATTSK